MTTKRVLGRPVYHQVLVSHELGGAGATALNLARHTGVSGELTHVWIPAIGSAWEQATRMGLACHPYDVRGAASGIKIRAGVANWRISRRLKSHGSGIVHVHSPWVYGALSWAFKQSGVSRVVHVHLDEEEAGMRWALKSPPELVITCARFLVDLACRCLPDGTRERTRVVAVPNAVDIELFRPGCKREAKARLGADVDRPLLLMLANLSPHKGQETAIRAVGLLKQRGVDVTCWLAGVERNGESSYTQRLQSLIQEAGVADHVQLLGQRGDAPDLLRAADYFLLPSTNEGLPLSILEAQASKVPVLAAPTAGIPEVIHDGETGFLIPADDAEGYAHRIEQLLMNPDFGRRISGAAFVKTCLDHNWPAYCRQIIRLYTDVLGRQRRERGTEQSDSRFGSEENAQLCR